MSKYRTFLKRTAALLLIFSILSLGACGREETLETAETGAAASEMTAPETTEPGTAEPETTVPETTEPEITETETEKAETTENESAEPETSESETPEPAESETVRFFGLPTDPRIAEINGKTLQDPDSGLYDVLHPGEFTNSSVREMIESYSFPEKAYLGDSETDPETADEIRGNRNLTCLSNDEIIEPRFAVVTGNTDVRAFPTGLESREVPDDQAFDYLQESMFRIGEGVIVLHESQDREWLFVQGYNYYGWILREKAAFCDFSTFTEWLSPEHFLVVTAARLAMDGVSYKLGTVVPYTEKREDCWMVRIPAKNADGDLFFRDAAWAFPVQEWNEENPPHLHEGFIPYAPERLAVFAKSLHGAEYAWGDSDFGYDCSSLAGACYRCYGLYLPRNTSQMKHFAGGSASEVLEISGYSEEQKLDVISRCPGAILVMPGHCMIYTGMDGSVVLPESKVMHCVTGYFEDAACTRFLELSRSAESDLMKMYRGDGTSFLERIETVLYVPD